LKTINHKHDMKRIILAVAVTTFAFGAFAGGDGCCQKDKAACGDKDKAACAAKTAGCPAMKGKCAAGGEVAKDSSKKLQSPKEANKS
jgi:hypothetical protein